MRITHFNTDDSRGGAARAAIRLHRGLLAGGDESAFLVRNQTGLHANVPGISVASPATDPPYLGLIQEWYVDHRRTDVCQTIFSAGLSGVSVASHPLVMQADVLNLHWVANFLTTDEIARLLTLNKPLVWTLHDQWPMTGGCHYSAGCQRFATACHACPQLEADELELVQGSFTDRSEAYGGRITAVTPSAWMARQARASSIFREARIETIPNSVDHDVFRPKSKPEARRKLGLPTNAFVLLFACSAAFEKRKGIPLFRALLKELGDGLFSLFVGWQTAESDSAPNQKHFGFVNDDSLLCDIYNAADVLAHLASEDNLPNMPLEAMACGTPVLGLKNGGLPEIVDDGVTGVLAPGGDFSGLVEAARALMRDRARPTAYGVAARKAVEERFTRAIQARRYAALYAQLEPAKVRVLPRYNHTQAKICDLISISADLRLAAEVRKAEQRGRDEMAPTVSRLKQEKEKLERRVRKIERNLGYRVVSGLTDRARKAGRALRGGKSGPAG